MNAVVELMERMPWYHLTIRCAAWLDANTGTQRTMGGIVVGPANVLLEPGERVLPDNSVRFDWRYHA